MVVPTPVSGDVETLVFSHAGVAEGRELNKQCRGLGSICRRCSAARLSSPRQSADNAMSDIHDRLSASILCSQFFYGHLCFWSLRLHRSRFSGARHASQCHWHVPWYILFRGAYLGSWRIVSSIRKNVIADVVNVCCGELPCSYILAGIVRAAKGDGAIRPPAINSILKAKQQVQFVLTLSKTRHHLSCILPNPLPFNRHGNISLCKLCPAQPCPGP